MNKYLPLMTGVFAISCITATAQEDVVLDNDFRLSIPTLPSGISLSHGTSLPPINVSQEVDISNQLSDLDNQNYGVDYTVSIISDQLTCDEGFNSINEVSLYAASNTNAVDIVPLYILNLDEKHAGVLHLPFNKDTKSLLNMLKEGPVQLVLAVTVNTDGFINNNFPTHCHSNVKLHLNISASKSL